MTMNDFNPYVQRLINAKIAEAMTDTPVIFLAGSRQTGKTTLVRKLAEQQGMEYCTLDDNATLLSAKQDPISFIQSLNTAVIDEVQRAPELLLALKKTVDEDRRPGRFLLTGSANLMALPQVADSLAGRMETLKLYPFSQSELHNRNSNWLDAIFNDEILQASQAETGADLVNIVLQGGFPEMRSRQTPKRRNAWAKQYLDALLLRDVRDIAEIDKLDQLPRLLRALANYAGQMCNFSQLGAELGLNHKTIANYINIFEQIFLLKRIPAFAKTNLKRLIKTPKLQFIDSGLLSNLLGLSADSVAKDRNQFGHVLETFVYGELLKHQSLAEQDYEILYFRDHAQNEVDFVIENAQGELVAIEVKASATLQKSDFKGLNKFSELVPNKFKMGILFYDGKQTLPMGNNNWAVPIASLWGTL